MRVLIVKTSALGDIVHAMGLLEGIKQQGAEIDWVVERRFAELVEAHPMVDRVIKIDTHAWRKGWWKSKKLRRDCILELRKKRYDVLFDLQGNIKSGWVTLRARADKKVGFGWKSLAEWPNGLFTRIKVNPPRGVNVRESLLCVVRAFFPNAELAPHVELIQLPKKSHALSHRLTEDFVEEETGSCSIRSKEGFHVVVCPGSAWKNKQVTNEALIDFLIRLKQYSSCYGSSGQESSARFTQTGFQDTQHHSGPYSMGVTQSSLSQSRIYHSWIYHWVWGNEKEHQQVTHLRTHCGGEVIPKGSLIELQRTMGEADLVIAMDSLPLHLCGTTSTPSFSLFGPSAAAIYKPVGKHHGFLQGKCPYGQAFDRRCPKLRSCPTGACIRGFTGEEIFRAFQAWFEAIHPPPTTVSPR